MTISPVAMTLTLTLLWFVAYWIVGGVLFAIVGLVRFMRLNKARFSCLFTLLSFATAYGAAWMGVSAALRGGEGRCLAKANALYQVIPRVFTCSAHSVFFSALLWFVLLMTLGIGLMFVSRLPDRPRQIPKV